MDAVDKDIISVTHPGQDVFYDARQLTRDFCDGTTMVHLHADKYTPREGNINHDRLREDEYVWKQRANWTEVYSAVRAAKDASVGLVLAQPPALGKKTPQQIKDFSENIDGRGNHLMIFARELLDEGLMDGVNGVMVDLPPWPDGVERTEENRIRMNIRPSWSRYTADDIINWDGEMVGSAWKLTFLVLREENVEKTGKYRSEKVTRYREVNLSLETGAVTWALWRMKKRTGTNGEPQTMADFKLEGKGAIEAVLGQPLGYIPFVPYYGQKPITHFVCCPPLSGIAELNLGYYRVVSDRRWAMHMHFAPTLEIVGREPGPDGLYPNIRLGVGAVIDVPIGGSVSFVTPQGNAFDPSEKELTRISTEMGSLSLAFLARDKGTQPETATAKRLEAESGKSSLALAAQNLQDCLERLFEITCEFLGMPDKGLVEVEVKLTYELNKLLAPTIVALNTMLNDNNISLETFLLILKNGGVLPASIEPLDEEARIAMARVEAQIRAQEQAAQSADLATQTAVQVAAAKSSAGA